MISYRQLQIIFENNNKHFIFTAEKDLRVSRRKVMERNEVRSVVPRLQDALRSPTDPSDKGNLRRAKQAPGIVKSDDGRL